MTQKHQNPDGTWDGVGLLSEISGVSRQEIKDTWSQLQANRKRLESCDQHDFSEIANPDEPTYQRKYRCKHCGGAVSPDEKKWYELGRSHAKK